MQSLQQLAGQMHTSDAQLACPVCGNVLYATDKGNREVTYHCSSDEARFWDFDRGTAAQHEAKEHWDKSIREVFLNKDVA
jgi:hypothetical protein